jgi:hypothetical protein
MEFRDGKVIHETQYFAEPFDPPAWRGLKNDLSLGIKQELDFFGAKNRPTFCALNFFENRSSSYERIW